MFAYLLVLAVTATACSGSPTESTTTTGLSLPPTSEGTAPSASTSQEQGGIVVGPTFDVGRCPFDEPAGTDPECGTVTVLEDRDEPLGRTITLAVARFPSRNDATGPPLVYLEGGPGIGSLEALTFSWEPLFEALNADREIVLFDQRGTGLSEPVLDCPEVRALNLELLDDLLDTEELTALTLDALQPCRDRWSAAGIDLSQYNSADSAADVDEIRRALGYDRWDVFGVSYGTRLALTVMRDHPDGIRSVILDSTYPPEIDGVASIPGSASRAFQELFDGCAAQSSCSDAFGDVEAQLSRVREMLDASPMLVPVTDVFTGDRYEAILDGDAVLGLVFQSLYSEALLIDVPQMLADLESGNGSKAGLLVTLLIANQEFLAIGQNFSVQCHEEVAYADPAAASAAIDEYPQLAALVDGAFTQSGYAFEFCDTWGAGRGNPVEASAVASDIPTLVVAGEYDPITPPVFGRQVADRLTAATFVEYPGLGHGVATADGCPLSITLAFLAAPTESPDVSCAVTMPPAEFSTPGSLSQPAAGVREVSQFGTTVSAVLPLEWEEIAPGFFARAASGTDQTTIAVQAAQVGGMGDLILSTFATQLGVDGEIPEIAPFSDGTREWRRYAVEIDGVSLDIAIFEESSSTLAVILVADPRDREMLEAVVLEPALESIEIVP